MAKQRSKRKNPSYSQGIQATKERQRQNGGIVVEPINEKSNGITYTRRHRALYECALDAYRFHGTISEAEYEAGLKFNREYSRSVLKIKVYDNGAGSHGDVEMPTISAINGNRVLREAFEALSPAYRNVIISVCVENYRAGTGRRLKYLCKGLRILAKHWNMLQSYILHNVTLLCNIL